MVRIQKKYIDAQLMHRNHRTPASGELHTLTLMKYYQEKNVRLRKEADEASLAARGTIDRSRRLTLDTLCERLHREATDAEAALAKLRINGQCRREME